jgi:hypothetical protein
LIADIQGVDKQTTPTKYFFQRENRRTVRLIEYPPWLAADILLLKRYAKILPY